MESLTEKYGQLLLCQLFTQVWYGNWDDFEETIEQLPSELQDQFPFYKVYDREETEIWHENYFEIPGEYFIPPYLSSYQDDSINAEEKKKEDLFHLITTFDKLGFYYPLEKDQFPDHIGSLTAFITATLAEEIKALQQSDMELIHQLQEIKKEMYEKFLQPTIERMWKEHKHKISDPFFESFIPYFASNIKTSAGS